jgi:hypothetical protein
LRNSGDYHQFENKTDTKKKKKKKKKTGKKKRQRNRNEMNKKKRSERRRREKERSREKKKRKKRKNGKKKRRRKRWKRLVGALGWCDSVAIVWNKRIQTSSGCSDHIWASLCHTYDALSCMCHTRRETDSRTLSEI